MLHKIKNCYEYILSRWEEFRTAINIRYQAAKNLAILGIFPITLNKFSDPSYIFYHAKIIELCKIYSLTSCNKFRTFENIMNVL